MHGEQHQDPLSRAEEASMQREWAEGGLQGSLQIHNSHRHDKVIQRFESFGLDTWKGIDPTTYHILVKPDFVDFLPSIIKYLIFIASNWISIGNVTQKGFKICDTSSSAENTKYMFLKTSEIQIMHAEAFSIQKWYKLGTQNFRNVDIYQASKVQQKDCAVLPHGNHFNNAF